MKTKSFMTLALFIVFACLCQTASAQFPTFSKQIPMTNYKIAVPVKIIGNLDKWNPAAWKTGAFYVNPLTGFDAP